MATSPLQLPRFPESVEFSPARASEPPRKPLERRIPQVLRILFDVLTHHQVRSASCFLAISNQFVFLRFALLLAVRAKLVVDRLRQRGCQNITHKVRKKTLLSDHAALLWKKQAQRKPTAAIIRSIVLIHSTWLRLLAALRDFRILSMVHDFIPVSPLPDLRGEAAKHYRIHTKARFRAIRGCAKTANGPNSK